MQINNNCEMDSGKRVMQPEADFDLNMETPLDRDEECTMAKKTKILEVEVDFYQNIEPPQDKQKECKVVKKTRIFELEAGLDHMMVTSKKEKERNKELKKELIEYIEENNMPIETKELENIKDPNLLWESIILLKGLMDMDPEVSSSQSAFSNDKRN